MKPDEKTIDEFKKAYFQECGEELSQAEACEVFARLANVLRLIFYPQNHMPVDRDRGTGNVAPKG